MDPAPWQTLLNAVRRSGLCEASSGAWPKRSSSRNGSWPLKRSASSPTRRTFRWGTRWCPRRALAHDIGPAHKSIRLHTPNARVEIDGQVLDMQITCEWELAPVPEAVRLAGIRARRPIGGFSRWVEPDEPEPEPELEPDPGLDSNREDEDNGEQEVCCGR